MAACRDTAKLQQEMDAAQSAMRYTIRHFLDKGDFHSFIVTSIRGLGDGRVLERSMAQPGSWWVALGANIFGEDDPVVLVDADDIMNFVW